MAKKSRKTNSGRKPQSGKHGASSTPLSKTLDEMFGGGLEGSTASEAGETTGRMILTVIDPGKESVKSAIRSMANMTGMSAAESGILSSADMPDGELDQADMDSANFVVLENLGIVIMNASPEESAMAAQATPQDQNVVVEPEYWNYSLGQPATTEMSGLDPYDSGRTESPMNPGQGFSREYLLGAQRMLDFLMQQSGVSGAAEMVAAQQCFSDSQTATWGLQATGVVGSSLSGRGVRVAVLDTGFDAGHPDFVGRTVQRRSFIPSSEPDNDVNDRNGHGTHCIGTSCGSRRPGVGPRYGIAYEASIFAGKVLRQGSDGRAAGADGWILAGINWALQNRCQVISMSLGARAASAEFPMSYEMAAQRGLQAGTLILAATGNDSQRRFGLIDPVGRPANCPSIAGIAAVDRCMGVADFSNGQKFGSGGEVNFAGPGVGVLSSVPMPRRRSVFNGTSMATPHAAGIAALICQQTGKTGMNLYVEMRSRAQALGLRRDFGNGLVRV